MRRVLLPRALLAWVLAVGMLVAAAGPGSAAPVFADGFESGTTSAWTKVKNFTVQTDVVHGGTYAGRATSPGGTSSFAFKTLSATQADLYLDAWVNLLSAGGSNTILLRLRTGGGSSLVTLSVNSSRKLWVKNHVAGTKKTSATALPTGWHELQLHARVGDSPLIEVWLDGTQLTDLTVTTSLGSSGTGRIQLAGSSSAFDAAFDDVVADTQFIGGTSPSPSPTSSPSPSPTSSPPPSTGALVATAGDIACDPADPGFNGGNGTADRCRQLHTAALLDGADAVIPVGDTQYDCGGLQAYQQSYDPSWGTKKSITYPAVGEDEYNTAGTDCGAEGADGFFTYFAQGAARDPGPNGYYSFDLGSWHVVVLNSVCGRVGGCDEGSPQNDWLEQDLASSTAACTLAVAHHPRFASRKSGNFASDRTLPFWQDLYADGAEIILGGNSHFYERFLPQDPAGNLDTSSGIVQFVIGTGGKSLGSLGNPRAPNSAAGTDTTFGILRLTLRDGGYDWQFVPEGSSSFTDSGSASCH
jgi:hypothetical protein